MNKARRNFHEDMSFEMLGDATVGLGSCEQTWANHVQSLSALVLRPGMVLQFSDQQLLELTVCHDKMPVDEAFEKKQA